MLKRDSLDIPLSMKLELEASLMSLATEECRRDRFRERFRDDFLCAERAIVIAPACERYQVAQISQNE